MSTPPDAARAAPVVREPLFHRPAFGMSRADFGRMLAGEFQGVVVSEHPGNRRFVFGGFDCRYVDGVHDDAYSEQSTLRASDADTYLLTDAPARSRRATRRTALGRRETNGRRAVEHAGEPVQETP